ncbi:hypothetical protein Q8F55_008888 [Vanrija albida]|uniref:UDENN domain-containing protein n=1 Tax=Vanrija albida TaxID=181172 RepID=A0ABR3PSZ7_9TREE
MADSDKDKDDALLSPAAADSDDDAPTPTPAEPESTPESEPTPEPAPEAKPSPKPSPRQAPPSPSPVRNAIALPLAPEPATEADEPTETLLDSPRERPISTTSSGISYEEVGFDDAASTWTEAAPGIPGSPARSVGSIYSSNSHQTIYATLAAGGATPTGGLSRVVTGSGVREHEIPLVLGVAVVDFNHLIGPTVEYAYPPSLQEAFTADEQLSRLLPFLALPDGAHLSEEDYSFFHCRYNPGSEKAVATDVPANRTLFGISCNRQIAAADLVRKSSDVTRSMVQKAVVVIASQPVFGPVRDRLGVVTRAFFAQRDFGSTQILQDFYLSLEASLEGKFSEHAIYMGTSLRELVHKFRHRTLVLLKMLLLQKRVMLFGYPVEMLCTYQYSLLSLVPGLLMSLRDSGDPALDYRKQRDRPTSLRTSDRASLLRYMGLPLHLFGHDSFFQPYLPLQQMDMLQSSSWLVGTTNQIVTQQKDCRYDLLVNIEHTTFEFADPKVERLVALTAADRKWMDDIVHTVEDTWNVADGERSDFRGSDDDLRNRFEDYICAFLASIKYSDFMAQSMPKSLDGTAAVGVSDEPNPLTNFSEAYAAAFRKTPACDLWESTTDPVIFDLCEPRHPCDGKVSTVSDIGIRLSEGLHGLRLEQSLAPTREALSSAFATGSATLFKAFDGVRSEVSARLEAERVRRAARDNTPPSDGTITPTGQTPPATVQPANAAAATDNVRQTIGSIGSSVGSFFGSRMSSWNRSTPPTPARRNSGMRPLSLSPGAPRTQAAATSTAALLAKK